MKKKTKKGIIYFTGIIISAALSFYAFWSAIFYAWMNANGSWTAEKAKPWAFGSLAACAVLLVLAVYFLIKFIQAIKEKSHTTI